MVEGYNIAFKIGDKTFAGRTQDDLNITPSTKESITKDDQGNKQVINTGHEITFSCQGMVEVDSSSGTTTKIFRDDLIDMALAKGSTAVYAFSYTCEGGATYSGKAVCTGYTESSSAEDTATWTISFKVSGDMAKAS